MARTVVIAGCSSGLGKASAKAFLDEGWNVVASVRDPGARRDPIADRLHLTALDVTDPVSVGAAVKLTRDLFGRIECLANNAGQALLSVVETTPVQRARATFDINVFGPIQMMQAVLLVFREQGEGRIINLISGSPITPDPFMAIYSASKCALEGLTEGMRFELRSLGVSVE